MKNRLRELCSKKGTSFKAVERELGFANGSLAKSDEKIQAVRLKMLADYFDVTMEYLLTGSETPQETLSAPERELLHLFRKLAPEGRTELLSYAKYKGNTQESAEGKVG